MSDPKSTRTNQSPAASTLIADILDTESFWLRQAKADLSRRDPLDALNDAEQLVKFATLNLKRMFERTKL